MNQSTRPTVADATSLIQSTTFTRLPSGTAIVCELTLFNMHTVHGIANVVDFDNYDEARGRQAAETKARDNLFELVAFLMHTDMMEQKLPNNHAALVAEYQRLHGIKSVVLGAPK